MNSSTFLIAFLFSFSLKSQEEYKENLWLSVQVKKNWNDNYCVTVDAGYRAFDHFIKDNRTLLGRVIFEKFINPKNSIGLGYAYFDHQQTDRISENRFMLQYRNIQKFNNSELGLRVRNEYRIYPMKKNTLNRLRGQISYQYNNIHAYFQPSFAFEMMYTAGNKKTQNNEQRYQLSIFSKWSKTLSTRAFWTFQKQSFIKELQNILGLQLNIDIK